jgi:hypothetical protein
LKNQAKFVYNTVVTIVDSTTRKNHEYKNFLHNKQTKIKMVIKTEMASRISVHNSPNYVLIKNQRHQQSQSSKIYKNYLYQVKNQNLNVISCHHIIPFINSLCIFHSLNILLPSKFVVLISRCLHNNCDKG